MDRGGSSASLLGPVALAIVGYLLAVTLIGDIAGEFPINDDWAYALPVEWAHRWGVVRFTNWQYMTLIGQTVLGWLWTTLFGFSYFGLRILTLIVAAGGSIALFLLGRMAIGEARIAALLAIGWTVNPVFLVSAASFMTDIYFWAAATGSILCLFLALERGRTSLLIVGWALTLLAMAVRQMAIAIPIGFLVADLARNGWSWRPFARTVPAILLLVLFLAAFNRIVASTIGLPSQYPLPAKQLAAVLHDILHLHPNALAPTVRGLATGGLYLGMFGTPLALALAAERRPLRNALVWIVAGIALAIVLLTRMPFPLAGNTVQTWGLGPRTLVDMPAPTHAGWLGYLLSAFACCSLGIFAGTLVTALRDGSTLGAKLRRHWMPVGLIVIALVGYAPLILVYGPWFDRHMLMAAPLLLIAIVAIVRPRGPVPILAWAMVGLTGLASILLVHDYFAWQRARWALAEHGAGMRHLPLLAIDAGFEYDNVLRHPARPGAAPMPAPMHGTPDYARCFVSAAPLAGRIAIDQIAVKRWLPLGTPMLYFSCAN